MSGQRGPGVPGSKIPDGSQNFTFVLAAGFLRVHSQRCYGVESSREGQS